MGIEQNFRKALSAKRTAQLDPADLEQAVSRLEALVEDAAEREYHDRHLSSAERQEIVDLDRQVNPWLKRPANLDDAFSQIIFE